MSARYMPKTLAKTINYILYRSPAEYGLFWNPDGTMPWKELYWAMQEDPALRFVREMHVKELTYLGLEVPTSLDAGILQLKPGYPAPSYPLVDQLPKRLYHACRRTHFPSVRLIGLAASARPLLPLAADKELALRMGRRRDPDPILIEVDARKACLAGISFRKAGPELYLVELIPVQYLIIPPVREDDLLQLTLKRKKDKHPVVPETSATPGSFLMSADQLRGSAGEAQGAAKGKKKRKGADDWKRQSRKERHKRLV